MTTLKALALVTLLSHFLTTGVSAACGDLPHTTCKRNYEKVGGFIEKGESRVMPELLINDRDCSSDKNDGHKLDWHKFEQSIHSLACRCAAKAKEKGWKVFGLQFFGECWGGSSAEVNFAKYGPADASKSYQIIGNPPPPCDKNKDQECIGGPFINYVYRLKDDQESANVDGGYTKWSEWTSCSKTCGGGEKGRERSCTNPKPKGNGKDCSTLGPAEQIAPCNEKACPDPDIDGKWSPWQKWSSCSETCGGGVRVRERECNNPAPSGHGKKCVGAAEETGQCALDPCPIPCVKALDIGIIIDGSGSVRFYNFKIALAFIEDLITHFKVSSKDTHFGIITYNHRAQLQFTMADSRYHNFVALKSKVKSIRYTGGWTRTDRALEMASSTLFTAAGGDRPDKANILIVFTDGKTNRGSKPYAEVLRPLQQKGVRTVAVGIGRGINNDELLDIAMDNPHYVVKVDRFEHLKNKLDAILEDSCQGIQPPTPEPECTEEGVPLGMQSGKIPSASLSASSIWDVNHGTDRARLHTKASRGKQGAWSARYNDKGQYYQVDFGKPVKIAKILTQGRQDANQWVTSYWLSYSQDNGVYEPYVHEDGKGKVIFKGNKDRNTIQTNKLTVPIFARYLRLHPISWYRHISMRLEIYGCSKGFNPPVVPTCLSALGLQSGAVPDAKMTASSQWSSAYRPGNARLYYQKTRGRNGAWAARYNNEDQWLQVDFGKMTKVRMVGSQGRSDADQWIVNYWISYSRDGVFWQKTDVFTGNSDRYTVVRNLIDPPIYGRYFRIHPKQYHKHVSLRAEFYGCTSGLVVPPIPCSDELGMQGRSIPDASITASSMWDANHGPARARLGTSRYGRKTGAWSSKSNNKGQWLQIKLNKISKITRIATQGRQDANQWVKSYTIQYSQDGGHYLSYRGGKVFVGNNNRNTLKGHVLDPPIIARFIRVLPMSWYRHISMRMEVYGCTSGFPLPPPPRCLKALGVQSKANKHIKMSASSEWDSYCGPNNGRLHFQRAGRVRGAWCALRNNRYQWLGVDLGKVTKVTMFATQGRQDAAQWVKTYLLSYSLDGYEYNTYSIKRQPKVFGGNSDQHTVVTHRLTQPIYARYVRIVPWTWYRHISMRIEVYGCTEGFVPPSLPKCREPLGLQNGLVKDSQITASSQWHVSHRPANARLYFHAVRGRTGGWSSRYNTPNQWIQVDFQKPVKISAVATQGREDANQWIKKYSLSYSQDGVFWRDYTDKGDGKSKLINGNTNRYAVVRHILEEPIIARFVRIEPKTWYRHISMRAEFYGCRKGFAVPTIPCFKALGMKSRAIPDSKITSSSQWTSNHSPARARLDTTRSGHRTGAWSAKVNDNGQWIQADLGKVHKVSGIVTQGRQDANQWVKKYDLFYSNDGIQFKKYASFTGNSNRNTKIGHILKPAITARYIRINPRSWYRHISMRFDLYGCSEGIVQPTDHPCLRPLVLSESQMSASTEWHKSHRAGNGRLNFHAGHGRTGGWSARKNNRDQWLQADFGKVMDVRRCATQGRQDASQWIKSYTISYSYDGVFWFDYSAKGRVVVFNGNTDRYTVIGHNFSPTFSARYVRINPLSWYRHISMRLQCYGCVKGSQIPPGKCASSLGPQSEQNPRSVFSASSMWGANYSPSRARLGTRREGRKTGAWSSRYNNHVQWIMVDFGKIVKVTRIATQGRDDANQWVKSYTIQYGLTKYFESYNKGQVYHGNNDRKTVVGHVLEPPIIARYIRIHPKSWYGHISMRLEFYGCTKGFVPPPIPNCANEFPLKDSQLSASSEWSRTHGARNAKLNLQSGRGRTGAWSSRYNDRNQWLQIDLGKASKITIISSQGRADARQWVTRYTVDYSVHGNAFLHLMEGVSKKVFSGNTDQHTVVSHKLSTPIIARYVRIRPQSWYRHMSMRVGLYGCTKGFVVPSAKCGNALGLESGIIPDSRVTASSHWNNNYRASNARLNFMAGSGRTGAWSARRNDKNQWLQVDFGKIAKIEKCATQGRSDANQWVTKYTLSYSREGVFWNNYPKLFGANKDRSSVVTNSINPPIYARFIRIHPKAWYRHISMRAEFYGCTSGFQPPPQECAASLGMENPAVIPDNRITASSVWNVHHNAARARLNTVRQGHKTGAWSARHNNAAQWLQVDFGKFVKITGIATQGRHDANQWVKSYRLQYSADGGHFENYNEGKSLLGNKDRNTIVGHRLVKPIIARFIRVRPLSWQSHISLRMALYGCRKGFPVVPVPLCQGSIHLGDWMMSSSTLWGINYGPSNAKLDFTGGGGKRGAWSARRNDVNQWLQVGFDREMKVTRISVQGRYDANQWVKSFTIEYSANGASFKTYKERGVVRVFNGNRDRNTIVSYALKTPIVGLAIRFRPRSWHGHISMRIGLYGCPTGKKPANPPCHSPMDVGVIMDRSGSIGRSNFKTSQDFVVKMIRHFEYASSQSRFGVIAYNSRANLILRFRDKSAQNPHSLENLVYGIGYSGGGTRTDRAIDLASGHLYSSSGGYQSNRPNVLFVLTDGRTNRGSRPYKTVLSPLLRKKVKVIAVGVGRGVNNGELLQIASYQKRNVFHVNDFRGLFNQLNQILKASCPS